MRADKLIIFLWVHNIFKSLNNLYFKARIFLFLIFNLFFYFLHIILDAYNEEENRILL